MVSFGDTVNFFLIVIQETPLFNQHTLFSSLRGRILDDEDETVLPPPRRAFSAMIAASGIPSLLARSPTTVFTALAVNAYKSVLEAQRKLCLAFLTSDAMSRTKI